MELNQVLYMDKHFRKTSNLHIFDHLEFQLGVGAKTKRPNNTFNN